jgi:hypothetical protein
VKRFELLHLLRAASRIVDDKDILVLGSQAILGSYDEDDLPDDAVASIEADLTFFGDSPGQEKSDLVDMEIGHDSLFHGAHGYYADGIDIRSAVLPAGWEARLVVLEDPASGARGHCLERHDLAVSKLVAGRLKDRTFVSAVIEAELVDVRVLRERARYLPTATYTKRVMDWLQQF